MKNKVAALWKEPNFDIITELSSETRTIYIKNISPNTTVENLKFVNIIINENF